MKTETMKTTSTSRTLKAMHNRHSFLSLFLTAICSFAICAGPATHTTYAMEPAGSFVSETSVTAMAPASADGDTSRTVSISNNNIEDANNVGYIATEFALSKLGYPYSMARRDSGEAFDCSSLIYYAYKDAGVDISHDGATSAAEIARGLSDSGETIDSEDSLEPGDLIFYSYKNNGRYKNISHVAMYIGDGRQVEASYSKQEIATRKLSLDSMVMIARPVG